MSNILPLEVIAPLAAGIAATLSVLAFNAFFFADLSKRRIEKRLGGVRSARAALRDQHIDASRKGRQAEQNLALMKKAVESFRMEDLISNPELRMKLAQAGYRGRNAAIKFLFMRVMLPPVMGIGSFLYLYFIYQPDDWNLPRYLMVSIGAALFGYYLPGILLHNEKTKRQQNITKYFPDALDLLTICIESGMSIEQSFNRVSAEIGPQSLPLAEELQLTTAELSYIGNRRQAYENLALRTDLPEIRSVVSAFTQAESHGTPVGVALRTISDESRTTRMSKAEQKAAALPAKMTVPMIVFFVPALFVLLLGPAMLKLPGG